jgi:hypothetical protein
MAGLRGSHAGSEEALPAGGTVHKGDLMAGLRGSHAGSVEALPAAAGGYRAHFRHSPRHK